MANYVTEVLEFTKRHADNSGNHADLSPIKTVIAPSNDSALLKMPHYKTWGALHKCKWSNETAQWPNRERQMYKCHESYKSWRPVNPIFTLQARLNAIERYYLFLDELLLFQINNRLTTSKTLCNWLILTDSSILAEKSRIEIVSSPTKNKSLLIFMGGLRFHGESSFS